MTQKIENIFERGELKSTQDIIRWWVKGLGFLNLFYLLYAIFHLAIILFVFNNGWIFFLFPIIFAIGVIINSFYLLGLITEIVVSKLLKINLDFDTLSPKIKKAIIIISILFTISCSLYEIITL